MKIQVNNGIIDIDEEIDSEALLSRLKEAFSEYCDIAKITGKNIIPYMEVKRIGSVYYHKLYRAWIDDNANITKKRYIMGGETYSDLFLDADNEDDVKFAESSLLEDKIKTTIAENIKDRDNMRLTLPMLLISSVARMIKGDKEDILEEVKEIRDIADDVLEFNTFLE